MLGHETCSFKTAFRRREVLFSQILLTLKNKISLLINDITINETQQFHINSQLVYQEVLDKFRLI